MSANEHDNLPNESKVHYIDESLLEKLRLLRKQLAEREMVPLYMVFSNASLLAMATVCPSTKEALATIKGIGKYKVHRYGSKVLDVINGHLTQSSMHLSPKLPKEKRAHEHSIAQTLRLYEQGVGIAAIAEQRGLAVGTVKSHLIQAYSNGADLPVDQFVPMEKQEVLDKVFTYLQTTQLTKIMEYLSNGYSYDDLRWVRAKLQRQAIVKARAA